LHSGDRANAKSSQDLLPKLLDGVTHHVVDAVDFWCNHAHRELFRRYEELPYGTNQHKDMITAPLSPIII